MQSRLRGSDSWVPVVGSRQFCNSLHVPHTPAASRVGGTPTRTCRPSRLLGWNLALRGGGENRREQERCQRAKQNSTSEVQPVQKQPLGLPALL